MSQSRAGNILQLWQLIEEQHLFHGMPHLFQYV